MSGYRVTLEAAGARVLQYETFGSYQGDWWAKVYYKGKLGWINGSFGSCSGCDAFEAEIGRIDSHSHGKDYIGSYSELEELRADVSCAECIKILKRLAEFGEGYLEEILTQDEAEAKAAENISWDQDAESMLAFIKEHK